MIKKVLKTQLNQLYMAIKLIPLRDFEIKSQMSFLFDTNIWMFLFCPLGNYQQRQQESASNFLALTRRTGCEIVVTSLSLSEFTNAYLRLDFDLWKKELHNPQASYKRDYLLTDRYESTQMLVEDSVNQILGLCVRYSDNFNSIEIPDVLTNFRKVDFNDAYYSSICEEKNWILFTGDRDFEKVTANITVVTIW